MRKLLPVASVFVLTGALAPGCATGWRHTADWRIVAADQQTRSAVIVSGAPGATPSFLWQWDPAKDPGIRAEDADAFAAIDECKVRDGGKTLLVNASCSGVACIDVPTCRAKWYAKASRGGSGPHSLDVLPDGRVAVANAAGCDALEIVDVALAPLDPPAQRRVRAADIRGAHGVVWDATRRSLFVLGYTYLYEFSYRPESMSVKELRRWDYVAACGDEFGHDLVPDGDGRYYMTNHTGVWLFNPDDGTFAHVLAKANVKSFSHDVNKGDLLQIPTEEWYSNRLIVVQPDGTERTVGPFGEAKFYKARWMTECH